VIKNVGKNFSKMSRDELADAAVKASKEKKNAIKPRTKANSQETTTKATTNGIKNKKEQKPGKKWGSH
jgi:hypothetical protein